MVEDSMIQAEEREALTQVMSGGKNNCVYAPLDGNLVMIATTNGGGQKRLVGASFIATE
jgi:hypothetical protein